MKRALAAAGVVAVLGASGVVVKMASNRSTQMAIAQHKQKLSQEGELQIVPSARPAGNPSSSALAASPKGLTGAAVGTRRSPEREPVNANTQGQPSQDEASLAPLPYTTQKYLHDPFNETLPARPRALAAISSTPAATSTAPDPNDWTNCTPSNGSPEPDAAGKANIKRANEWATAASAKAASLGLGEKRYDPLRCRGEAIADWLADGGQEPLHWLFLDGFESPLATCTFQSVFDRSDAQKLSDAIATPHVFVTFNGKRHPAALKDKECTAGCVAVFDAACEFEHEPSKVFFEGDPAQKCLNVKTGAFTDGPCSR